MATTDSEAMGRRIAEARARTGLTQEELAAQISIDRSALAKIEKGSRRVSALELARIAHVLQERIEWFVLDTPPAIVSHRNVTEPGAASPAIDQVAERIAWHVEFVDKNDDRLALVSPEFMARPRSPEEVEKAAATARRLLRLDTSEPCFDVSKRLAHVGLFTFAFDLGADAADAASLHLRQGGIALINGHLHVGRRRLAAAHEFGHYLFADEYTVDWRVGESEDDAAWEARLDRFGRALLLPPQAVRASWSTLRSQGDDLRTASVKLASAFRVDMSTLARRLLELELVPPSEAHRVRQTRTTRADIIEFNLLVNDELAAPHLPQAYQAAVLRLYRQETVTAARATDLLFDTWDEDDLPELPKLPQSAVWNLV
ncbi:helix-turn-helix domain-containing protein [Micromonospora siamensis]|uniref:Helix-turn-helix n=1 Tax=Micromonospora siamensis TaxID=299152 RepID=A0A1C5K3N1_9ACTN|nr:XRE family transcriptional regulator [Micromonospora siamensis]SCG77360.1 Helix-turn-helix [Micromonospora siamensis]